MPLTIFIFRDVQSVTNDVSKSISQKTKKNSYSVHTSSIDASGTRIQEKSVSFVSCDFEKNAKF